MLKRRQKCALYIDFENVQLDPAGMANVLDWIEDGAFEAGGGRRRKLLVKTIYWNATAERNRERYEALGFEVVLCDKYANLKNGADIRIAMDMVEARARRPNIQEFILLSKDSDFVPVLQRLRQRKRKTAVLVDESKPAIYTVYTEAADITFPVRRLMGEGRAYIRPVRGLLSWVALPWRKSSKAGSAMGSASPAAHVATSNAPPPRNPGLDLAAERIVAAASRNSGQPTGRQAITRELQAIPGFSSSGADRYFGYGGYEAMIRAVVARDTRIAVRGEPGGGMSIVFVGSAAAPALTAKPASQQSARA